MTCYKPLKAFKSTQGITFFEDRSCMQIKVQLPCGQCIGCRLEKSRQWAIRCHYEARMHEFNSFITLTYDNKHLPEDGSLQMKDFQDFMKRLRSKFARGFTYVDRMGNEFFLQKDVIRFYHADEYGERTRRPHYHAIIFGIDFPDKILFKERGDTKLYKSKILEEIWGKGYVSVGNVTFESAGYVARYVMKKVTGKNADKHYEVTCPVTAEILKLAPEYATMSRRPGIAAGYIAQEGVAYDIYKDDTVVLRRDGKPMRPPKFFDNFYELIDPEHFAEIKAKRVVAAYKHADNCTPERLAVREQVKLSMLAKLVRPLD